MRFFRPNSNASGGLTESLLGDKISQVSPSPSPSPQTSPVTGNGVLVRSCWPNTGDEVPKYLTNLPQYLSPEITPELSRVPTGDACTMNYLSLSRFLWYMIQYGNIDSWFLAGLLTSTANKTVTKQILCKKMSKKVFVAIINIVKSKKSDVGESLNNTYIDKLIFIDYNGLADNDENPTVRVVSISSTSLVKTTDLDNMLTSIGSSTLYAIDPNSVPDPSITVRYVNGGKTISEIITVVDEIYYSHPELNVHPFYRSNPSAARPAQGGKRSKKVTFKNRKYRPIRKIKSRKYRHYRSKKRY